MNKRSWMMMRILMNRYCPKKVNTLLKFLPEEEAQAIMTQEIYSTDLIPLVQPQASLAKIHYSWIQPNLEKFPAALQPALMAALATEHIAGLKRVTTPVTISKTTKAFIIDQFYQHLAIKEHFPIQYLPETELSPLAKWTHSQLINLIDFLGLYDLASEVRHIVNRNHLKNIYTCLTPKQFHYLKICLHQKEQLVSPKLGIDPTTQDCSKLKQIIHRRGLIRLGKALWGEHTDLVWHIAHTLDIKRGTILLKEYQPKELSKVTKILKQQAVNLMHFLIAK